MSYNYSLTLFTPPPPSNSSQSTPPPSHSSQLRVRSLFLFFILRKMLFNYETIKLTTLAIITHAVQGRDNSIHVETLAIQLFIMQSWNSSQPH